MKKRTLIAILGILVAALPVLGFPSSWKRVMFMLSGLIIAYLALAGRRGMISQFSSSHVEEPRTPQVQQAAPAVSHAPLASQAYVPAPVAPMRRSTPSQNPAPRPSVASEKTEEDSEAALVAELAAIAPKPKKARKEPLKNALKADKTSAYLEQPAVQPSEFKNENHG